MTEMNHTNEMNEMNEQNETNETNSRNGTNEMNEMNGRNERPSPRTTNVRPAKSKCRATCHKSRFTRKFTGKMRPRMSPEREYTFCASLRTQNAGQDFTRAHFIRKFTGKMPQPRLSPERGHTHTHTHFVRACAVETHVKILHARLYTKIYRQQAAEESEHPDQAPTFASTVRTPQCRHTVWARMFLHSSRQINCDLQPNILSNIFSLTHILVLSPTLPTIFQHSI